MPTLKASDQINGRTQAAGISPSSRGIGRKRIDGFVSRAQDMVMALDSVLEAQQSGDPAAVAVAEKLLGNAEFVRTFIGALEKFKAELVKANAAAAKSPDHVGPDYPESASPNNRPGTDSRAAGVPGSYSVADLNRDIASSGHAVRMASQTGMDSAAPMQFVPAWDSASWSPEARERYRERASYDGAAAAHIAKAGDLPAYQSEHNSRKGAEAFLDKYGVQETPARPDRPFDR